MDIIKRSLLIILSVLVSSGLMAISEVPTLEQIKALESLKIDGISSASAERNFKEIEVSKDKPFREPCPACIYGYDLFNQAATTFSLSTNVPVPPDYVLGPGDKLSIEYYGNDNYEKEGYIVRNGVFHLPLLGPVTLAGLTFSQANNLISRKVSSGLIGTKVFLTLSDLRSINIYVVGAAYQPGTYTISALSTITNALFSSGGPNQQGSLRNIELKRNGKIIKKYDFYDLLLSGDTSSDSRMQEGDVLFIPLLKKTSTIKGAVPRTGTFEIKQSENISDLLEYSGYKDQNGRLELSRINVESSTREFSLFDASEIAKLNQTLQDGDTINIVESSDLIARNATIGGEVVYPGIYGINQGETILSLIKKAGGLKQNAFTPGSVFTREDVKIIQKKGYEQTADSLEKSLIDAVSQGANIEGEAYLAIQEFIVNLRQKESEGRQVVETDLYLLKSDPRLNINLQDGDTLFIPMRSSSISVVGEVLNSATHIFKEELSVEDYVQLSGGYSGGADKTKVFVILPNGQSVLLKDRLFGNSLKNQLLPGSAIVVSRDPDPFNTLKLIGVLTPVLSDLAISAAAISAISDN